MITEFAEKGSLENALYLSRLYNKKIPLSKKLSILLATARGIEYLHGLTPTVIHRDLKPGNILLDYSSDAKICDFGLSRTISISRMQSAMTTHLGTLFYAPPELQGATETAMASKHTATKIDVYSFAMIMWELFFELVPFSNSEKFSMFRKEPHEFNVYNTLNMILNGIRPTIPFENIEEISQWIQVYMPEESSNANITEIVKIYFEIVTRNWDQNATKRSTISKIIEELEYLQKLSNI